MVAGQIGLKDIFTLSLVGYIINVDEMRVEFA
jgi:hypothetical protein